MKYIKIGAVAVLAAVIIALITVAAYRAATDPCRCVKRKCWTVSSTGVDSEGRVYHTTSVDCRCLKKWCPAEACP